MGEPPDGQSASTVSAYRAYSYLADGPALPPSGLAPEFGRVPPWDGGLTGAELARAERLFAGSPVVSLHDHPVRFPVDMADTPAHYRVGRQHTAYAGLAASGLTLVLDNMTDGTACISGSAPWQWADVVTDLGMRQADLAHQDGVRLVRDVADIEAVRRDGRVGIVFGLESATPIGNQIDRLDVLYGLGIRQIGIAYSDSNALGSGRNEAVDGGLTAFGRRAVGRMNELGLAVDVSHSSDRTGIDACRASTRPVLLTHGGARRVWDIPRMASDDCLRAVAETGGVIGISAAPHTTVSAAHPRHSIESVMDHFRYCVELVGVDHVGFGPDTLYGDHVGLHTVFADLLGTSGIGAPVHERVRWVDGLENPTENFRNICRWLVRHEFSDGDIRAVLGGNALRVLGQIWAPQ